MFSIYFLSVSVFQIRTFTRLEKALQVDKDNSKWVNCFIDKFLFHSTFFECLKTLLFFL